MKELFEQLRCSFQGEIHEDLITRQIYSVDASIYQVEPIGVVSPRSLKDLETLVHLAAQFEIPLTARGAATGITGGCLGEGIIVDLSRHFNQIIAIDYERERVVCEPGVVQDRLNEALATKGYCLGPDTSTGNRATLGGMLANNAAGSRSLRYGKMVDHIEEVEILLASGKLLRLGTVDEKSYLEKLKLTNEEGAIYRAIDQIRREYREDIEKSFPMIPRRVSGYNLDTLLSSPPFSLAKLIAGSEGSLGIVTQMTLRICKKPLHTGLCLLYFQDMVEAMNQIEEMLHFAPLSLEMIDRKIMEAGRRSPLLKKKLQWLQDGSELIFIAEFDGETKEIVREKLEQFAANMKARSIGTGYSILDDPTACNTLWQLRKAGLGLLLSKRSYSRAIAFIEDLSLPPERLGEFMRKFLAYLKEIGEEAGIYGHVGSGCLHIRPFIDLRKREEVKFMRKIMLDVADLVIEHGGALSGEHGDGLIRTWLNEKMFGPRIYQAFIALKEVFDPLYLMNPGKVVKGPPLEQHLKTDSYSKWNEPSTFLDFGKEGGFALSVDLCNGNGECRKKEGLMCPSFQATRNEYDTTRARAQALRGMIQGKWPSDFSSHEILDVLDLCLECKGCKKECPSQVDMAKMKSEYLYQYQKKNGIPLRSRLFGHIDSIYKIAQFFPTLFNQFNHSIIGKEIFSWFGIAKERSLPWLAEERFSSWFEKREKNGKRGRGQVILLNDTYNEFNQPEIGKSAVHILEMLGYQVMIPTWSCCGRPLISKGLLPQAQQRARRLIDLLHPYAQKGIPIIGLEPSCILTIKSDFNALFSASEFMMKEKVACIENSCITLDQFLYQQIDILEKHWKKDLSPNRIKLHVHCYQKALIGTSHSLSLLRTIPGIEVDEIPSGCCGMAGSFGYEEEHLEISLKIGSLALFPSILDSDSDTLFIANGISCRTQITHGTSRQAYHLAEIVKRYL